MNKGEKYAIGVGIVVGLYLLYQINQTNAQLSQINKIGDGVNPILAKINQWLGG